MSIQICPVCDVTFDHDDDIVAVMVSKFKQIDSSTAFAIDHPTRCIEIVHSACYDWEDHEESVGEIN